MGGPIVVNAAYKRVLKNVIGVTVIDVVEGSAMEALSLMKKFIDARPTSFASVEQAILWRQRTFSIKHPLNNSRFIVFIVFNQKR